MQGLGRQPPIGKLAASQHGVIARRQLVELGIGAGAIDHRLKTGSLSPVHRGVYAVGHAKLSLEGRWMAAVLACGHAALLSHRSAAALLTLTGVPSVPPEVVVPRKAGRGPRGVIRRGSRTLVAGDAREVEGIPVTSMARTLLDLAEVSFPCAFRRAFETAQRRGVDAREIRAVCARNNGRRGAALLLALVAASPDEPPDIRSELEGDFLDFCRSRGIPLPATNVFVAGYVVDAFWPQAGLVVELDSFEWHKDRAAFERDRRRDAALLAAGLRVLRITSRRMRFDPSALAAELLSAIAAGSPAEGRRG